MGKGIPDMKSEDKTFMYLKNITEVYRWEVGHIDSETFEIETLRGVLKNGKQTIITPKKIERLSEKILFVTDLNDNQYKLIKGEPDGS